MSERLSPADRAGALALHHALGSAVEASIAKEIREALQEDRAATSGRIKAMESALTRKRQAFIEHAELAGRVRKERDAALKEAETHRARAEMLRETAKCLRAARTDVWVDQGRLRKEVETLHDSAEMDEISHGLTMKALHEAREQRDEAFEKLTEAVAEKADKRLAAEDQRDDAIQQRDELARLAFQYFGSHSAQGPTASRLYAAATTYISTESDE